MTAACARRQGTRRSARVLGATAQPSIIGRMSFFIDHPLRRAGVLSAVVVWGLSACTPALNWREIRPPDSAASALFPCKPDHHTRRVTLAGAELAMHLSSCSAEDGVYALSRIDAGAPDRVTPVLQALRAAAAENIGGASTVQGAQSVPGMTPHPLAQRLGWRGARADGSPIAMQATFFVQGTQVYQATVVSTRLDADAVETFFSGLNLR